MNIRTELNIPNDIISDEELDEALEHSVGIVNNNLGELYRMLTCYQISRRFGDDKASNYYRSVILGKLNLAQD
jgi:hypothetical protein